MEPTVRVLFRKYLDWCLRHRSARTAEWYAGHLGSFLAHLADRADQPLASLRPYHVVEWVDSHETVRYDDAEREYVKKGGSQQTMG
jgi:hypothetical protein